MIEHHESAERARGQVRLEERIDHRQAVAEHVGERDGDELAAAARPVFDDPRLDMAVLDHHGVVEHRHVGHAAVAMARIEIGAEDRVLLRGRHRDPHVAGDVGVAARDAAHARRRTKILGDDAHRDAGAAALAGRPVGDRLAAPEAALGQDIVELGRALADQVRKHLPLFLAAEIGAGRRRGQVELRSVARVLGHNG